MMSAPIHRESICHDHPILSNLPPGRAVIVQATVTHGARFSAAEFHEIQSKWNLARSSLVSRSLEMGAGPPEHADWDWANKLDNIETGRNTLVVIQCQNDVQGLMSVLTSPQYSEFSGQHVVYVDYLESAPWNLRIGGNEPRYLGVGTILIGESIALSHDLGLEGRIGLHSLRQAEPFYRDKCRMTDNGPDAGCEQLAYFEFSSQQAAEFLVRIGASQ
jgi:hypothetical protein